MKKDLKITGIKASNFKGIETIEVLLKDEHTRVIGLNGDGKTTLKEVVQACFIGISQTDRGGSLIGEKFRFIGRKGKAADLEITLEDVKGGFTVVVRNHITKDTNGIKIQASDCRELSKEWLKGFFNAAFMSADTFLSHTPQQQTELLGINTSIYDDKIADLKSDATVIRKQRNAIGDPEDLPKVEPVHISDLYAEKERIATHNSEQDKIAEGIRSSQEYIKDHLEKLEKLQSEVQNIHDSIKGMQDHIKTIPKSEDFLSFDEINDKFANAASTNQQAAAYEANEKKRAAKKAAVNELAKNQIDIGKEIEKRTDYIKSFELPLKGLTVDEKGGLLLDDRKLSSFSKGECEIIVANLCASQNPHFKTRWIDEFQSLDSDNQKKIVDGLINKGFTVITSEVGDEKKGDGSILLKGCAVVGAVKKEEVEDTRESAL